MHNSRSFSLLRNYVDECLENLFADNSPNTEVIYFPDFTK